MGSRKVGAGFKPPIDGEVENSARDGDRRMLPKPETTGKLS